MTNYKELVAALREKESRDNRELLDAAAREIENLRDELCQRCGKYRVAHMGGCNGCRYE